MYIFEEFLRSLYHYLLGIQDTNNNIVRKHTKNLHSHGDLSCPLDVSNLEQILKRNNLVNQHNTSVNLFKYQEDTNGLQQDLLEHSSSWPLKVYKCTNINNNLHMFLDRSCAFSLAIKEVLKLEKTFGSCDLNINSSLYLHNNLVGKPDSALSLTELRIKIIQSVVRNLLLFSRVKVLDSLESNCQQMLFAHAGKNCENSCTVVCGAVLNSSGVKDNTTTAEEYYRKRAIDMRLMAEHKYGLRITSQPGWKEFFEKLGKAAVTMELLQNKPNRTLAISLSDNTLSNNKGASFILYNCARLATLFKEFETKVADGVYPNLIAAEQADFSLLIEPEEWELLYVHIMQFPATIKSVVKDALEGKVGPHYVTLSLSALCSTFSVYYRRVKILTEPKSHLIPVLFARIHLLKAVEQVLHNGLRLFNVEPVKQM